MNQNKVYPASNDESIGHAADILKKGGLVAFPTETVYGLGADAGNYEAVCKIFEVKKRPVFDPLIVHVSSVAQARSLWSKVPKVCETLMEKFWPGPLTLVLPKSEQVLDLVTSGLPTVAVRMPKHEAALKLIKVFGKPVAAPSANLFGYTSPTLARHVAEDMGEKVDLILDGGSCAVGVESTVLQVEGEKGVILRPGGIDTETLSPFILLKESTSTFKQKPSAPGMLESHYAPHTKMVLLEKGVSGSKLEEMVKKYKALGVKKIGFLAFKSVPHKDFFDAFEILSVKGDLKEAASNLFQAIRKLDKMRLDMMLAESVPSEGIGIAILDRLRKAGA